MAKRRGVFTAAFLLLVLAASPTVAPLSSVPLAIAARSTGVASVHDSSPAVVGPATSLVSLTEGNVAATAASLGITTASSVNMQSAQNLAAPSAVSQSQPFWQVDWGGSNEESGSAVAVGPDGSVYVTGGTDSFCSCGGQVFLLKYSQSGNLIWQVTWWDGNADGANAVAVAPDGSAVYVAGFTKSSSINQSLLLKFSPTNGSVKWAEVWGGGGGTGAQYWANGIAVAADGSVYVAGADITVVAGIPYTDGFLAKYSSSGSAVWQQVWSRAEGLGLHDDEGISVTVGPDGSVYVTGKEAMGTVTHTLVMKFAPSGVLNWQVYLYGANAYSAGEGVSVTPDGRALYVGGMDYSIQLENGSSAFAFTAESASFVANLDPRDGHLVWREEWVDEPSATEFDFATSVAAASDDGAYLVGMTNGKGVPFGEDAAFILKLSSSGAMVAESAWIGSATTSAWGAAASSNGSIFVAGDVSAGPPYSLTAITTGVLSSSMGPSIPADESVANPSFNPQSLKQNSSQVSGNTVYSGDDDAVLLKFSPPVSIGFAANPANAGSTSPSGQQEYFPGTSVSVSATSNPGSSYLFGYWSASSSVSFACAAISTSCISTTATINGGGTITANFLVPFEVSPAPPGACYTLSPAPYALETATANACGTGTYGGRGSFYYLPEESVTLGSQVPPGYNTQEFTLTPASTLVGNDATNSSPPTTIDVQMPQTPVSATIEYFSYTSQNPSGDIIFTEAGLPNSAPWTWAVTLTGYSLANEPANYTQSSTANEIRFTGFVPGSYPWSVGPVSAGGCTYTPDQPSGTYDSARVSQLTIQFILRSCDVTFSESNLPTGTSWMVVFDGRPYGSTTSTITIARVDAGPHSWSAPTQACGLGCRYAPNPASGVMALPSQTTQTIGYTLQHQVTIVAGPDGSVSPTGTSWYNDGSSVAIAATPSTGYSLSSWSSSTSSITFACSSCPTTTAVIDGAGIITANFIQGSTVTFTASGLPSGITWSVTFNGQSYSSSSSTISVGGVTSGSFTWTTVPTISGGTGIQYVASPTSGTMSVPAQTSQTITFATQYQVAFAVSPSGVGSTSPSGTNWYNAASAVTISATANAGFTFHSWSANPASSISTSNPSSASTSATINGPGTLTANFLQASSDLISQSCNSNATFVSSTSCTLPVAVTAGDLLVVEVSDVPAITVTDSLGNAFTLLTNVPLPGSTYYVSFYYATARASGTETVTMSGAGNYPSIVVHELHGVTGVGVYSTGQGDSTNPSVSLSGATANSFVLAVVLAQNSALSVSGGPGYTFIGEYPGILADEYASVTGTTTSPFVMEAVAGWAEISVAFASANSGQTGQSFVQMASSLNTAVRGSVASGFTNGLNSVTFSLPVTAGDTMVIEVLGQQAQSCTQYPTLRDTLGNSFTSLVASGDGLDVAYVFMTNSSYSGSDTISDNGVSGCSSYASLLIDAYELSGTWGLHGSGGTSGTNGTTVFSGINLTPAPNDVIVGVATSSAVNSPLTCTALQGYASGTYCGSLDGLGDPVFDEYTSTGIANGTLTVSQSLSDVFALMAALTPS